MAETYTVEVVRASTGGDATTARLKVTSASGKDNQPIVTPVAFGSPIPIGTRGLTLTLTAGDDLYLGDKFVIAATTVYTPPAVSITGTYSANTRVNRDYLIEVLQGGAFTDTLIVRVSTTAVTTTLDKSF